MNDRCDIARARRRHGSSRGVIAAILTCMLFLAGCYSFKGGSAPAHLQTVYLPPVEDASGFGRATLRQSVSQELARKFREDNSLRVIDAQTADSRFEVTITGVRNNEPLNLTGGEREAVRRVVVDVRASFIDNVRRRPVFKDRTFSANAQYNIDEGVVGENEAFRVAIDELTSTLLLEAVASW